MIGVIDYGIGNMFSLSNALKYLNIEFVTISDPASLDSVDALILPGVGAFAEGMRNLNRTGMISALRGSKKPLLGICLGMQLLFEESEEFELTKGLGLIPGRIIKITGSVKIPHMGWNQLIIHQDSIITTNISNGSFVYFVHSYKAITSEKHVIATADYESDIVSIVQNGNIYGTQFHPEKSGATGLNILKSFVGGVNC
ncbi:MAG: imidazole glycerol phosphate synthase subunit HisH [Christensenellaceae bacterium]|jgi:glutamine amidotransferase|nr:imidazole glycerol phosphate synthase subunit HisH [Christensenellaceae bacterium]